MGRSDPCNKAPVTKYLRQFAKNNSAKTISVLDLGIGEGDFGAIAKKTLPMTVKLTGVEIWTKYKHPQWKLYKKIHLVDIRTFLATEKKKYDLIFLIDVLEHFNKKDGAQVLKKLKELTKHALIISTPITNYPQGSYLDNPYEKHRYFWSDKKLEKEDFKQIFRKRVYTWQKKPRFSTLGIFVYESNTTKSK